MKKKLTQSRKLLYLVRLMWRSPVFGDSFPAAAYHNMFSQSDLISSHFMQSLTPILRGGMPDVTDDEVNAIVGQVAPKSLAFCASISAGEIQNVEHLSSAAIAIAISYWADQSMDRGDMAMLSVVEYLNHKNINNSTADLDELAPRLEALRNIKHYARQVTESPKDLPYVLLAIERDVLGNQAEMRSLSHKFIESPTSNFWNTYAAETAQKMIDGSGLMSAVAIIYALYKQQQPDLPSLEEIYGHMDLMRLVRGPFNSAVRVFDDAGDWRIDTGEDLNWGVFNINIFNQSHPKLVKAFLDYSGIREDQLIYTEILSAFSLPTSVSRPLVVQHYLKFVRQQIAEIPSPLWERYQVFFTLVKRTLEAGFINAVGDIFLSESAGPTTLESDLLKLIAPDADYLSL